MSNLNWSLPSVLGWGLALFPVLAWALGAAFQKANPWGFFRSLDLFTWASIVSSLLGLGLIVANWNQLSVIGYGPAVVVFWLVVNLFRIQLGTLTFADDTTQAAIFLGLGLTILLVISNWAASNLEISIQLQLRITLALLMASGVLALAGFILKKRSSAANYLLLPAKIVVAVFAVIAVGAIGYLKALAFPLIAFYLYVTEKIRPEPDSRASNPGEKVTVGDLIRGINKAQERGIDVLATPNPETVQAATPAQSCLTLDQERTVAAQLATSGDAWLLERAADLACYDGDSELLTVAAETDNWQVVRWLLENSAVCGRSPQALGAPTEI